MENDILASYASGFIWLGITKKDEEKKQKPLMLNHHLSSGYIYQSPCTFFPSNMDQILGMKAPNFSYL